MKFTILTACYNKVKFIKACVDSVATQSHKDWELIVVDDCSTDGSWDYLSSLNDPRIKIFRHEDRKFCSSSYATALKHATGEICGVVDGDDVLDKKAMAVVLKRYMAHPEIDFIYTQHHWCNGSLTTSRTGLSACPKKGKSLAQQAKAGRHCFSHWRTFRTHLRDKGLLFPEGLEVSVDKNLGFALEELGRGGFLPKKLYFYRYYRGNMSLVQAKSQKVTTLNMARQRLDERSKNGTSVYPVVKIE